MAVVAVALVWFVSAGLFTATFAFFAAFFGAGNGLLSVWVGRGLVDRAATGDASDARMIVSRWLGLAAFGMCY